MGFMLAEGKWAPAESGFQGKTNGEPRGLQSYPLEI
jgi:hypothetical protein